MSRVTFVTVAKILMNAQHKKKRRFAGIQRHAEALGVHRGHLWAVLAGKRESRSLLKRYEALRRSKREDEA